MRIADLDRKEQIGGSANQLKERDEVQGKLDSWIKREEIC